MDVKWEVCTDSLNKNEEKIPLTINGLNYRVDQNTAALTHMLVLLIDALEDISSDISSPLHSMKRSLYSMGSHSIDNKFTEQDKEI